MLVSVRPSMLDALIIILVPNGHAKCRGGGQWSWLRRDPILSRVVSFFTVLESWWALNRMMLLCSNNMLYPREDKENKQLLYAVCIHILT